MKVTHIPFKKTGFFSKTMLDYLEESETIKPFYNHFPKIENFKKQIAEKSSFSIAKRKVLVKSLKAQYQNVEISELTAHNIKVLASENTFTIVTGHQLNLFTGPLYFLYKIISVINLCEDLKQAYPEQNFVPIYWMASEDHDFEEINYFNFKGQKVQWNSEQTGGVGRFSTEGLDEVLKVFSEHLGASNNANYLKKLFESGYIKHDNLADATRYIANELFTDYGLVIVDGDDKELKRQFVPYIHKEFTANTSYTSVTKTMKSLGKHYKLQVNPREINLFYLTDNLRERIVASENGFKVNNTNIFWSLEALQNEVNEHPERFSPNVIMRPLYQEVILPNLCYVGGGGELAYWLQLKDYFNVVEVPFPMLLLRNSVQVVAKKQAKKLSNLAVSLEELFLKQNDLLKKKVTENSEVKVDFTQQKNFLQEQFNSLRAVAEKTDVSFIGAVNAQEKKQLKGLENLEKRLLRAEKRKQKDSVSRITALQNDLLPNQSLEERQRNFSEFYLEYGTEFVIVLKENLKPLQLEFTVVEL